MDKTIIIGEYFKKKFPIEHIKYNMYSEKDIYSKIPILSFRLSDDSCIDELRNNIQMFQGNLKWTIFKSFQSKRRSRYLLCPVEIYQMNKELFENDEIKSQKEYFSEIEYKKLCELGIKDILNLYNFIRSIYG